jgi:hypothetical protein
MGCGHLVKELTLVKRQCVIAPHVFQQLDLSSIMYVSNCSMGDLANEIPKFSNNKMLLLMVEA